jgi:hypothetical protein
MTFRVMLVDVASYRLATAPRAYPPPEGRGMVEDARLVGRAGETAELDAEFQWELALRCAACC